jgi:secreted trypsin-like serine protease
MRRLAAFPTLLAVLLVGSPASTDGGRPGEATAYPEAALVDALVDGQVGAYCSGALVAPSVVLTAGHCVKGEDGLVPDAWRVTLPYAGGVAVEATGAETYDWETTHGTVDPHRHDVGLVYLAHPVALPAGRCPRLASSAVDDATEVVHVGRLRAGRLSTSSLFVGEPVPVTGGAAAGFPLDYSARAVIAQGDSGGPAIVPGSVPHSIVAVASGALAGHNEVLARVDLLNREGNRWIAGRIRAHGGTCVDPQPTAETTRSSTSTSFTPSASAR